jgi:hypothetical protein
MERPISAPLPRPTTPPTTQNVRVVSRIRPLSTKEIDEQSTEAITALHGVISVLNDKQFEFDSVFGPEASQEDVYRGTVGNMIGDSVYRGFNATVLAYG